MPKRKINENFSISDTLSKKLNTSYVEVNDSNSFIQTKKFKTNTNKKSEESPKPELSIKKRKHQTQTLRKKKQKATTSENVTISDTLSKQLNSSYVEVKDSNSLIQTKKSKTNTNEKPEEVSKPELSKKKRKLLAQKLRKKEQKSTTSELYAELEAFNKLCPKDAITTLKNDLKSQPQQVRKNLSEKIKPISKNKLKAWKIPKTDKNNEEVKESSPDTSDMSTDEDEEEEDVEEVVMETDAVENIPNQSNTDNIDSKPEINQIDVNKKAEERKPEIVDEENELEKTNPNNYKLVPRTFVTVNRTKEIQESRLKLPILEEETSIMEAITENDVVIISGSTGCGKTTQLPQFLYEAGYANDGLKIGITEPRRVAAISMSDRVSKELGCNSNDDLVSYHIRYDKTATIGTKIKFMTDGVLLQELKQDTMLARYSAIIIDEAHERSVYSDILIGFLSIIVRSRRRKYENGDKNALLPLKLIIMSATLRVSDFSDNLKLFPGEIRPPVIVLSGRQFPVDIHFSRITPRDYLKEAFKRIVHIHGMEREGGILVFVTGQDEVQTLCKWLRLAFPLTNKFRDQIQKPNNKHKKPKEESKHELKEEKLIEVNLTDFSIIPLDEEAELIQMEPKRKEDDSEDEIESGDEYEDDIENNRIIDDIIGGAFKNISLENPVYVLPLYSLLSKEKQELVFKDPPVGQRLIVVATNVAETSLTIPNIQYVVDTGMEKVKRWDHITGISRFEIARISKSSAEQRAGRAGRVNAGKCYRLYSSAVFEEMKPFSDPEILQRPIEDVVLMLRQFLHSFIPIDKFPLPTIPTQTAIEKAERVLVSLGALYRFKSQSQSLTEITEIGKMMSSLPLNARFARMLIMANQHKLLPYAVLMVSVLSVNNFFTIGKLEVDNDDTQDTGLAHEFKRKFVKKKPDLLLGDISVLLGSMCQLERVSSTLNNEQEVKTIAEAHGVRWQAFLEVRKLRKQLTDILNANIKYLDLSIDPHLPRPTDTQFEYLRQLVLCGSATNVARIAPINLSVHKDQKQRRKEKGMYQCSSTNKPVYIHSQSVLHREKKEWICFQEVCKYYLNGKEEPKAYLRNVTAIDPEWLGIFCTFECRVEGLILNHIVDDDISFLPYYDENHDCIMACAKKIFYGENNLLLPLRTRVRLIPDILEDETVQGDKMRRWFAKFFMEGVIFKEMDSWRAKFKSNCKPDLILNPIGSNRQEVKNLMLEINKLQTQSRQSIIDKWKVDKNYLLNSYLDWVLPYEHQSIQSNWPPVAIE